MREQVTPMHPVQRDLPMPGCETPMQLAWRVHRNHLHWLTLDEALEHPLYGRLLRAHAGCIEQMRRRAALRRSSRRQRRG